MKPYLLIQSVDVNYAPYLELSYGRHAQYAQRCGADYLVYTGLKDEQCHPSWNRIALLQEGMAQGYEKLVWLDADVLVVDLGRNIFTETRDDVSLQMCRYDNYLWHGQPHYNAGVMVVCAGEDAMALLHEVWTAARHTAAPASCADLLGTKLGGGLCDGSPQGGRTPPAMLELRGTVCHLP